MGFFSEPDLLETTVFVPAIKIYIAIEIKRGKCHAIKKEILNICTFSKIISNSDLDPDFLQGREKGTGDFSSMYCTYIRW